MKLAGSIALVTGAQQGIGAAIAVALAKDLRRELKMPVPFHRLDQDWHQRL